MMLVVDTKPGLSEDELCLAEDPVTEEESREVQSAGAVYLKEFSISFSV